MKIKKLFADNKKLQERIFLDEISEESEIIKIIEISLDILEYFSKKNLKEFGDDIIPIRELVLRLQEIVKSVIVLCLNGHGLIGLGLLRDIVEIEYLLEYFRKDPDMIKVWWYSDDKTMWNKFRPNILRKKIAGNNTELKAKLDDDYKGHSNLSTHPSPMSLALQKGMKIKTEHHNHSYDFTAIRICLAETALHIFSVSQLVCLYGHAITQDKKFTFLGEKLDKFSKRLDTYTMISAVLLESRLGAFNKYLKNQRK